MVSSGSPPSIVTAPASARTKPAIRRNKDDLPAPLRPVIRRVSPPEMAKVTPENTSRPARRHTRADASSRIESQTGVAEKNELRSTLRLGPLSQVRLSDIWPRAKKVL